MGDTLCGEVQEDNNEEYLITIIRDILHCYLLKLLHIMWLPWICCWRHCLYIFLSSPKNQQTCGLFLQNYHIPYWRGNFLKYCCCLCCNCCCCFPKIMMLCGGTCHNYYIPPWINFHSCCYFYFILCSILEPSLLIHRFPVFFFRSVMSSRIKISLS